MSTDSGSDAIKAKVANAGQARGFRMLVIGGRDSEAGVVSVRLHGKGPQGAEPKGGSRRENSGGHQSTV